MKAAEAEHDLALTHDMRSRVFFSKADYNAALDEANLALQYEPGERDWRAQQAGRRGRRRGDPRWSTLAQSAHCSRHLRRPPPPPTVWFKPHITIGKCYSVTGRLSEAVAAYNKALTLVPPGHVKVRRTYGGRGEKGRGPHHG